MITKDQLFVLTKKFKINETAILREYIQLYFLSRLYDFSESQKIFFKGGTAIHFLYSSSRFSEDLDFTVEMREDDFLKFITNFFSLLKKEEPFEFKERKTIAGKRFLLSCQSSIVNFPIFINLDFSFREKIYFKEKSIINTEFPVTFRSYVYHPQKKEILAEKIRAFLTRTTGRDIYDLWFLLKSNTPIDYELVLKKLAYYKIKNFSFDDIIKKLEQFKKEEFVRDLKPFVSFSEREKLADFFDYLVDFFRKNLR